MTVYYTKDWDEPLLKRFPESIRINENCSKNLFELRQVQLPVDESLPAGVIPADITICTYVTPWVLDNETNLTQYKSLLNRLMEGSSSVLLTVDPSTSQSIIRDNLTNELQEVQNLYIEGLGLKGNNVNSEINCIADAVIWRKP